MTQKLLNFEEAKVALSIKSDNKFNELIKRGLPFIQHKGKGGKLSFYFPDMLEWMKEQTKNNKEVKSG